METGREAFTILTGTVFLHRVLSNALNHLGCGIGKDLNLWNVEM